MHVMEMSLFDSLVNQNLEEEKKERKEGGDGNFFVVENWDDRVNEGNGFYVTSSPFYV